MAPPTVITNRIIATHTNDEVLGSDIQHSESHGSSLRAYYAKECWKYFKIHHGTRNDYYDLLFQLMI